MEHMIDQITESRLAAACLCETSEVRWAASEGYICQVGVNDDGAPRYLCTAITTLKFSRAAQQAGFNSHEIRMMISMIEMFGGGAEYVEQVIDDKLKTIRMQYIRELENQQKVLMFRQWCRSQPDGYASLATIPQRVEGRLLS